MNAKKVVGLILVVLGVLALVYGGFSYQTESHDVALGSIEVEVSEKERVNVPVWLGVATIALGVLVLVIPGRSS